MNPRVPTTHQTSDSEIGTGFERLKAIDSIVPLHLISEPGKPGIHRFYDTSPISPSGRYLAYLAFPFEDRAPSEEDAATVMIADLRTGGRRNVATTTAWDTQVGAQVQWGATDEQLFYNVRAEHGDPRAVLFNVESGKSKTLDGPVYMVSPDGTTGLCPNLFKLGLVQKGYGMRVSDLEHYRHAGAPDDDGLFVTHVATGKTELLLSLRQIFEHVGKYLPNPDDGGLYGFHVKWHSASEWVLFVVRWLSRLRTGGVTRNFLLAYNPASGDLRLVVDPDTWGNGHHPNWWPTELDVIMNLPVRARGKLESLAFRAIRRLARPFGLNRRIPNGLRFVRVNALSGKRTVVAPNANGSGHPSIDPSGRFLLTDAYLNEPVAYSDGKVPIRLIDLTTGEETHLMKLDTTPKHHGQQDELRIDPHPAWSRCGRYVTVNTAVDGVRGVMVADLAEITAR